MERGLLVSAQLSTLFPSVQAVSIPIQTTRHTSSLPPLPSASDPPPEHASYSAVLHTPSTGTILLRVLCGGLILEIVSLSTTVPPVRFVFPALVLSSPAIFLWENELHILAVTSIGSLYRLVLPIDDGLHLWMHQTSNSSTREYHIKNFSGVVDGLVHVQGTHCVVISQLGGAILRLETGYLGLNGGEDEWTETIFQHTSFLSSLTSFLPTLSSTHSNGADIISIATHQWPTDVGHIWTLSRDRNLRFWKAKIGCVATKLLPLIPGREASPGPGGSSVPHILLDKEHQTLLRVFSIPSNEDHIFVLVFMPTPSSSTSGGTFQLLGTVSDQFYEIGNIECSKNSVHCHLQDFMVISDVLYTLWDRQGQSMVEKTVLNGTALTEGNFRGLPWQTSSYAPEPELTPAYLEELLISAGSLSAKFLEAILRPGMFSALTLRTAIEQYSEACASLPGPTPAQLTTTYSTVGENIAAVVGCTVNLNRDPHTGALQHANYWSALKRDWEGFIARCRELERSARWPLVLGAKGEGDIIVVERERVGSLVPEDLPIRYRRDLEEDRPIEPSHSIFGILWGLQSKLGAEFMLGLESRLLDIIHQENAFSFADIIQDQVSRMKFDEILDEGAKAWLEGRLQSVTDIDIATRSALDIIGGFDSDVKREEEEVELLLPPQRSDWSRALTATYITATVSARYDLCLALVTLLFFFADQLDVWDPTLLAEIFAVFRGVAILRFLTRQPAGDLSGSKPAEDVAADEVISRLRDMQVSRSLRGTHFTPTYSLIHRLLAQPADSVGITASAHHFLDGTGLMQSVSPANATKYEVIFCERLRALGYYESTREILSCLPRTAGVTYVQARLWLNIGRPDDAAYLMEKLAGAFGPDNALASEDHEALSFVLPATDPFDSAFFFYLHVSKLFRMASLVQLEVQFAQLALSVAPPEADTGSLWNTVIKGYTDLGLYDDAYSSLISTPYEKQKRELIAHLVYRMCEDNAVEKLVSFNFPGFADEVEESLAFKARNVDPRIHPSYSRILYSWHTFRGDHRKAALVMYQRGRKLQDLVASDFSLSATLSGQQQQSLMVAINSLSLVDAKNAWFILPVVVADREPHKRRKLTKHIPESRFTPGTSDAEIVTRSQIQYEHALLSAQIDMIQREPALSSFGDLPPESIVLRLAQSNRFNLGMATASSLDVDMTDLFAHLATQCLRLSRNPDSVEDSSDWLLTDKVSSWSGSQADRAWRYLRQSLERHDGPQTDYKYTKITLETILSLQRTLPPPPWLIHSLEEHHHEYLIRVTLRYENLEQCIAHTLSLIQKTDARLSREPTHHAASTWLPYNLIDQVLAVATEQDSPPAGLAQLRLEIANRPKRMQKLSSFKK
ncbi:nucleoporin Nup120/160-domain-containing protein [Roridomyces roridus]|uniref:Nucleoporin Nup120/160-domain-containing protein n=1 Tax=Roridomyces roridus TaxID=1738132 RepID=A0AAD7C3Z4_9AGAR|nr:nucleoporin Nup120/160-domain-containing protein [Roridomyces roridus]